ncbi:ANTAR domain-containing protein [Streptomyces sp. NPDC001443]
MEQAVATRHITGEAMGILVGSRHLTEEAFDTLRRHSRRSNTELREVARLIREHGALPQPAVRAGAAVLSTWAAHGPSRTPHPCHVLPRTDDPPPDRRTDGYVTAVRREHDPVLHPLCSTMRLRRASARGPEGRWLIRSGDPKRRRLRATRGQACCG